MNQASQRDYWLWLDQAMSRYGFTSENSIAADAPTRWFFRAGPDGSIKLHLRFIFKPKMSVLTAHIGWHHEHVQRFCVSALESDWPEGYSWLSDVHVVGSPCPSLFNLAGYLGWTRGGLPVGDATHMNGEIEDRLISQIEVNKWARFDSKNLLVRYVADEVPFDWRSSNSAVRLAQVAGLCSILGEGIDQFNRCATNYRALIEADMFGLGNADRWIASLRSRAMLT